MGGGEHFESGLEGQGDPNSSCRQESREDGIGRGPLPGRGLGKPQSPREARVWVQQAVEGQAGLCRGRGGRWALGWAQGREPGSELPGDQSP